LPIVEEIVPWNTIGCPPSKMGEFGRIFEKRQKIEVILKEPDDTIEKTGRI